MALPVANPEGTVTQETARVERQLLQKSLIQGFYKQRQLTMDTNKYLKKMLEMDRQRFKLDNERFLEQQRASRNAALGGGFGGVTGMTLSLIHI